MEPDGDLDPDTDDLPLRANTSHILVRHYVLDLTVDFDRRVIGGSVVLFLEPGPGAAAVPEDGVRAGAEERVCDGDAAAEDARPSHTDASWESTSEGDFTLVLDCCDLTVTKVEELDITSVSAMSSLLEGPPRERPEVGPVSLSAALIQKLLAVPSGQWRHQHRLFRLCSRASRFQDGLSLRFHTDRWSLQVRKKGVATPQEFPRAIRVCYETKPTGGSVRWTKDQDNRVCVYTAGSPINNRALFPCQEPPVAMSTWQATIRAPSECVVLMSGEDQAVPIEDGQTRLLIWDYYVTMPMPASTFTLAVGHWHSAFCYSCLEDEGHCVTDYSGMGDDSISCSHGDYPCRYTERSTWSQRVVPHRVFAPICLLQKAQMGVLSLLPRCLAAAHAILGVHPFPRLDILIVPAGFSSLGMASPHIIFLSQSVLHGGTPGSGESGRSLCGSRLCHEIAHSWFGLAIGARDWTEEWISEGFATYLEDIIWARAQQLSPQQTEEQSNLKALLRWRRLSDELQNSEEELQILRPNMENTGQVSESGSSVVKHALNPDKTFMQVHYLKGYFLLRFLASQVGEQPFIDFFRLFVKKYHGQLILSQVEAVVTSDQLVMLLELLLEEAELSATVLRILQSIYNLQKQDAEVRHRWCELVVKHGYSQAYADVEHFLVHDQAMGVYLYGELMVREDAEQQALAHRCLSLVQEEMDQSVRRVVEQMVL
uniref:Aminopeptidase O (putative) n=1 Tax=Myripristis murdjan TaxID=586833 RepID=A0A667XG04_9TELE